MEKVFSYAQLPNLTVDHIKRHARRADGSNEHNDIDCKHLSLASEKKAYSYYCRRDVPFDDTRERNFKDHLDPSRIAVPRFVIAQSSEMRLDISKRML